MEIIVFILVVLLIGKFWKLFLLLAGIGFFVMFVRGMFGMFDRLPPAEGWQTPWNVVHGQLDGNEIFWFVVIGAVLLAIAWVFVRGVIQGMKTAAEKERTRKFLEGA